jgi:hypothetical protein
MMAQSNAPLFGAGLQVNNPEDLARKRKIAEALMAVRPNPKTMWEGIQSAIGQIGGAVQNTSLDQSEKAAQDAYGKDYAALGDNPTKAQLEALAGSQWASPGQQAVVQAILGNQIKQDDPAYALDTEYKRAQIDALKAKPSSPLINAGNGEIYDPNNKQWITPPGSSAAAAEAPAVGFTPDGTIDQSAQQEFLKTLAPHDAVLVKGIIDYELDPAKVLSMRGGTESERQRLVTLAKMADPSYDGTQFGVRAAVRKDFTSGQSAQNLKSANTLIGHLHELLTASKGLGNSDVPLWNMVTNSVKSNTGKPEPVTYGVAAQASADELAKVFKGSGASDVESIKGWQAKLDPNASPAQQQAAITEGIRLLQSRIAALRDQYQAGTGKPASFTFLDAKAAKAIKDLGFEPTDIDPNYVDKGTPADSSSPGSPDERGAMGVPVPGFDNTYIKALP